MMWIPKRLFSNLTNHESNFINDHWAIPKIVPSVGLENIGYYYYYYYFIISCHRSVLLFKILSLLL